MIQPPVRALVYSADILRGAKDTNGNADAIRNCRLAEEAVGVQSIENMLSQLEATGKSYKYITICGHAAAGNQSIGGTYENDDVEKGIRAANDYQPRYDLVAGRLQDVAAQITRLRMVMENGGVLFLAGCTVAQGTQGRDLLKQVSAQMQGIWVVGIEGETTEQAEKKKPYIQVAKASEEGKLQGPIKETDLVMARNGRITNSFPADRSVDEMLQAMTIWGKSQ